MVRKLMLVTAALAVVGLVGLALSGPVLAQGPTATITSPSTGATVGATLPISGTAAGPNFSFYLVQFRLGDQWNLVDGNVHTAPVTTTAGLLASWDTTKYPDGAYDLRLLLADKSGQYITTTVSVTVDNTKTPKPAAVLPNRGCPACHVQIAPDGRYTLAWEAANAAQADGLTHPTLPNGFKSTEQDCLVCHKSQATGDAGVGAPLSLRAIVHPAHMFSEIFASEFHGNCFTCHDVDGAGNFAVITDKMNVNAHGVPVIK